MSVKDWQKRNGFDFENSTEGLNKISDRKVKLLYYGGACYLKKEIKQNKIMKFNFKITNCRYGGGVHIGVTDNREKDKNINNHRSAFSLDLSD